MEKKGKCYRCREYRVYYTKGYCNFIRQNVGYCTLQRLPVDANDGCADWKNKINSRGVLRVADGLRTLRETEESIAGLRQIFQEILEAEKERADKK